ncbi:glycosyltransferase [Chromobacterium vaccinii]|nr:glycosyltransferase [Chromobacterium vaccinii]
MKPNCTILLATYNGSSWLRPQLDSILSQRNVNISIAISDDSSDDKTCTILAEYEKKHSDKINVLSGNTTRMGSACKNFLRLIRDADVGNSEYIGFSDQDDVWHLNKIENSISSLKDNSAQGYSSCVMAFWPDGKEKFVNKSQKQKKLDFFFASPGPGCTFVLERQVYDELKAWVIEKQADLKDVWFHDWLIYAFVRSHGHKWVVDPVDSMRYRQHYSNEIGVNLGIKAILRRFRFISDGRYIEEAARMSSLFPTKDGLEYRLKRMNLADRIYLTLHSYSYRRRFQDVLFLCVIFLFACKLKKKQ